MVVGSNYTQRLAGTFQRPARATSPQQLEDLREAVGSFSSNLCELNRRGSQSTDTTVLDALLVCRAAS